MYALVGAPDEVVAAACFAAKPTCVSALARWGIPVVDPVPGTHLLVPESRHVVATSLRSLDAVVVHRHASAESAGLGYAPVSVATALGHAARCLTRRSLVAAADNALHRRIVSLSELDFAGRNMSGLGGGQLIRLVDPAAESVVESLARLELLDAGLSFRSQVRLDDVGRVDFLVEDCVVVEVDGREAHDNAVAFARDRRRDRAAQQLGLAVARFTYADVVHQAGTVAREVTAIVDQRWRRALSGPRVPSRGTVKQRSRPRHAECCD